MMKLHGMEQRDRQESQCVGRYREQQHERDHRMPPEDDSRDEIAEGDVGRERHRPRDRQHRLIEHVDRRTWISAGSIAAPMAAMTGSNARRHGWSTPPGAVASTTSLVISAKKNTIATSLTANAIA